MNLIEIELLLFIYFLKKLPLDNETTDNVYQVEYSNHLTCKCDCILKPENCLSPLTYDAENCLCKCEKKDEKCTSPHHMVILKIFFHLYICIYNSC